jgi:hypothetical protein
MVLFLLFINDIADDIQSLVRLFADDNSLIFSSTNPLEVEDRLWHILFIYSAYLPLLDMVTPKCL